MYTRMMTMIRAPLVHFLLIGAALYVLYGFFGQAPDETPAPAFEAVQERVKQDWQDDKRQELNEQYYAGLQTRYPVVIEDDSAADGLAALKEQSP